MADQYKFLQLRISSQLYDAIETEARQRGQSTPGRVSMNLVAREALERVFLDATQDRATKEG